MIAWIKRLFSRSPGISYYTVDGGVLAPHPNMTDDDLRDFETFFGIPSSFT